MRLINLTGSVFGRLTVLNRGTSYSNGQTAWVCKCVCGKVVTVHASCLTTKRRNPTRSCGCLSAEMASLRRKKSAGESSFTALYHRYRRSARLRNLCFDLSRDCVRILFESACFYCAAMPSKSYATSRGRGKKPASAYIYNGIDRMDSSVGYTMLNSVPCCWRCNECKKKYSVDDFLAMVVAVYSNLDNIRKYRDISETNSV